MLWVTGDRRRRPDDRCAARRTPHAVQHALAMRMKLVIDAFVDEYSELNQPLLSSELHINGERKSTGAYRPTDGLDPEFNGFGFDPSAAPEAPYLFTFGELASADFIRAELKLADAHASAMLPAKWGACLIWNMLAKSLALTRAL